MAISREQWQALSPLLAQAMELPDAAREAWLTDLDTTQPALSPLLRTLLAADRRAEQGQAFETASVLVGAMARAPSGFEAGQLIGPYLLSRPLGRGGMGEVWLSRQVDGGITRDVALKLPTLLGPASLWRERFRRERDILAKLQHPNIATLFDAGVADVAEGGGQPYLAMEYVDGPSLLDFATQRALSLRERIALFRQVLAAVGGAHRQLVIHRDLKPSNILVTQEGQAKLLDFGIAKLIEDDEATSAGGDDLTRLGGRLLTYRYAAPEQVHGETLSTATDVYALGVVLHELLTGLSPYRRVRDGAAPGLADFQQQDFAQPSSLPNAKGLAGDLDAIVLKALRREPGERYGTVEQFDDDLLRYLEHRPVLARRGSRRYRAGRFIVRNRLPLAAAVLVATSLIAGLVVAERQRRVAVAARARAERHFASVRELANTFIYDIEEDLRGLAGTLPVREKLARTSVKYLDSLSTESQVDPQLIAELAGGYRRVGEVFGGNGNGNLGNGDAAIQALQKAAALFDTLQKRGLESRRSLDDERRVHYALTTLLVSRKDPGWEQEHFRTLALARRLADEPGATAYDKVTAAGLMTEYVNNLRVLTPGPPPPTPVLDEARSRLRAVEMQVGSDVRTRGNLAIAYFTLAELLMVTDAPKADLQQAADGLQTAADLLKALQQDVPDDIVYATQRAMVQSTRVEALLQLGRLKESEAEIATVLPLSAQYLARDPQNVDTLLVHWQALTLGVETAFGTGQMVLAVQRAKEAWRLEASAPKDSLLRISESAVSRAKANYFGGRALLAAAPAQRALACQHLRAVEAFLPQREKEHPDEAAHGEAYGELKAALGRCPGLAASAAAAK
jgi:tRNA A-37 threonylcarbamoyl transferase component Bud32